jgi:hypothetical protein
MLSFFEDQPINFDILIADEPTSCPLRAKCGPVFISECDGCDMQASCPVLEGDEE